MTKTFLITFLLILISFASQAQEKAAQIFEQAQFNQEEVSEILSAYPELETIDIASLAQASAEDGNFSVFKLYAEATNDVYVIKKDVSGAGRIEVDKTFVPFDVSRKTFEGTINGTLLESIKETTGSERVARQISEAFKHEFSTTKGLKVGASYSFEVIEYFDNGQMVKYGDVLKAALVVGKAISERVLQQDLQTLSWDLLPVNKEKPFYAPVKMSRVSSLFNLARKHPVKRRIQPHNGIDFVAKAGTPVFPALEGTIIAIGRAKAKGKFILIEHDNGYQTTYDHLRKFTKGLRVGSRVEVSDQIGEVGRTGYATGAHLHFGIMKDGLYVNPLHLVKDYTFDQKDRYESETVDAEIDAEVDAIFGEEEITE